MSDISHLTSFLKYVKWKIWLIDPDNNTSATIFEELRFVKVGQVHHNETWHWNNAVNDVVKKKQSKWKQWKLAGSKQEY